MRSLLALGYKIFLTLFLVLAFGVLSIFYKEELSRSAQNENKISLKDLLKEGGEVTIPEGMAEGAVLADRDSLLTSTLDVNVPTTFNQDTRVEAELSVAGNIITESDFEGINLSLSEDASIGGLATVGSISLAGDTIADFTGTGLQVTAGVLETSLGADITSAEIADSSISEVDLAVTNTPSDNQILSYDSATGTFTWVTDANDGGDAVASPWTDAGSYIYADDTSDNLLLGGTTDLAKLTIDGDIDEIQAVIQGFTTQTANLTEWQDSSGTTLSYIDASGNFVGGIIGSVSAGFTQGSVVFADSLGDLAQDNTNFFWDDTNNWLGLGTSSPDSRLKIEQDVNFTDYTAAKIISTQEGANSAWTYGLEIQNVAPSNADNHGNMAGNYNFIYKPGTGTINSMYGDYNEVAYYSTANSSSANLYGGYNYVYSWNSGNVNNIYGVYNYAQSNSTVNNLYGTYSLVSPGSSATNAFAFYAPSVTGATNNYALVTNAGNVVFNEGGDASTDLRIEGDTDVNLFFVDASTDRVGIGTNSPEQLLHVSGGDVLLDYDQEIQFKDLSGTARTTFWVGDGEILNIRNNYGGDGGQIVFDSKIGGAESMRIESSGQVGIGTTSPTSLLDIEGYYAGNALVSLNDTGGNDIFTASASGTTRFVIQNDGNVGIGTSSPDYKLTLSGNGAGIQDLLGLYNPNSGEAIGTAIQFYGHSDKYQLGAIKSYSNSGSSGRLQFFTGQGGSLKSTPAIHIDNFNRIGLGDTSPAANLVIGDDTGANFADGTGDVYIQNDLEVDGNLYVSSSATTAGFWSQTDNAIYPAEYWTDEILIGGNATASADIRLGVDGTTVFNELGNDADFRIEGNTDANLLFVDASTDRIGVNVSNPAAKLEILGDDGSAAFQVSSSDGGRLFEIIPIGGDGGAWFQGFNSSGTEVLRLATQNGDSFINQGNLGIGDTSPDATLDIETTTPEVRITTTGTASFGSIKFYETTTQMAQIGVIGSTFGQANRRNDLELRATNGGDITINYDGLSNLGVGLNDPEHFVEIEGYYAGNALVSLNETGGNDIFTASASGTTRFVIQNDGDVGIGTSSPISPLQATKTSAGSVSSIFTLSNKSATNGTGASIDFNLATNDAILAQIKAVRNNELTSSDTELQFVTTGSSSTTTKMVLDYNGNLGLGDTTPDHFVDFEGHYAGNALVSLNETGSNDIFTASASGTTRFVIQNDGDVGIGTNAPGYALDVSGIGNFSSHLATQGRLYLGVPLSNLLLENNSNDLYVTNNNSNGDIRLFTQNSGFFNYSIYGGSQIFRIDAGTQTLKLGTGVGSHKLDIEGYYAGNALVSLNDTGGNDIFTASASGTTRFVIQNSGLTDASVDGIATLVNAGAITDGSYSGTAVNGLLGVDSTNGRFYFRYGGGWHYVAQTAGFQIPNYEGYAYDFDKSEFKTDVRIEDGDFLIPFAEKRMADDAVHGLYARFSDVKQDIFGDVYTRLSDLEFTNNSPIDEYKFNYETELAEVYKQVEQEYISKAELEKHLSFGDKIINIFSTVVFNAKTIYKDSVEYIADVTFRGSIKVNADTAGEVSIPANTKKFRVRFETVFDQKPIVYLKVDNAGVEVNTIEVTNEYFEAEVVPSIDQAIQIKWLALLSEDINSDRLEIIESSETVQQIEVIEQIEITESSASAEIVETQQASGSAEINN